MINPPLALREGGPGPPITPRGPSPAADHTRRLSGRAGRARTALGPLLVQDAVAALAALNDIPGPQCVVRAAVCDTPSPAAAQHKGSPLLRRVPPPQTLTRQTTAAASAVRSTGQQKRPPWAAARAPLARTAPVADSSQHQLFAMAPPRRAAFAGPGVHGRARWTGHAPPHEYVTALLAAFAAGSIGGG